MFELLVPAEAAQLEPRCAGDKKAYDRDVRPALMVRAIRGACRTPASSPTSGRSRDSIVARTASKVVAAARRDGRGEVGCIILGRGEDEKKVEEWLRTAADVPGFIGFAVGRTTFWDPLMAWRGGKQLAGAGGGRDRAPLPPLVRHLPARDLTRFGHVCSYVVEGVLTPAGTPRRRAGVT